MTETLTVLRWLSRAGLSPLAGCVMLAVDPAQTPMDMGDIADRTGLTLQEAAHALQELQDRGFAVEEHRAYAPTAAGLRAHHALAAARRADVSAERDS